MKRLLAMILSAALLLSLTACGSVLGNDSTQTPEVYVPSKDIEVAVTYVTGASTGNARVVTRRTSDKELSGIDLACVYYDVNGKQIREYERIECTFSTKDEMSIWTFSAPARTSYIEAAIAAVTYADGTKETCPGVSAWAEQTAAAFTVDGYKKALEEMAGKEAAAAEKCDAVEYTAAAPENKEMSLKLKNTSGKEIADVIAYLLWFDANGAPIDMKGVLVPNSEKVSAKNLVADEEATYTVNAPEGAVSVKAVIQKVVFADETVWQNDYVYEWAVVNSAAAK